MEEIILKFIFNNKEVKKLKCKRNERMEDIIKNNFNDLPNLNKYDFIYNGEIINKDNNFANFNAINNEITIFIKEKKVNNSLPILERALSNPIKNEYKQSKEFICPICKTCCIVDFKDYKMSFSNCEKNHINESLLLEEYDKTQQVIKNKLCTDCPRKDIGFYRCINCKINLCLSCKSKHNKEHIIIDLESVNYSCDIHGEKYILYCLNCNKNLCKLCKKTHDKNHHFYNFEKKELNHNIKNDLNNLKYKINLFTDNIKSIINKLQQVINIIQIYLRINNDIIFNYEKQNKNYQIFKNVENISKYNQLIIKDIDEIINTNDDLNKFKLIYQIYKKMTIKEKSLPMNSKNDINIEYKITNKNNKVKIFGREFVDNNKNICQIIINNKVRELSQNIDINSYQLIDDEILKVQLKIKDLNKMTNISYMFSGCKELYSLPDISSIRLNNINGIDHLFCLCESLSSIDENISDWDISKVTDISYIFNGCKSLKSLPDISKWNTSNVVNMRNLFSGCKFLSSLPDISKWDLSKAEDLSYLFSECYSLKNLPEISEWNLNNATDINHMFNSCSSLKEIPDISKWNTCNIKNMIYLFAGCNSLVKMPDISNWDTSNITNLISIFNSCQSLEELPDISKWDTSNIIDMSYLFYNCYSLTSLQDISKWTTKNVINMSYMFYYCQSLEEIPDISKWDISNVENLSNMFCGCDSIIEFPDLSIWNTGNVANMSYIFANCYSLNKLPDISKWKISKNANTEQMFYYSKKSQENKNNGKKDDCLII